MTEKDKQQQHLIRQAAAGDRNAFAELVAAYYPIIFRTAFKWCGKKDDAEDIAQEVCIKLGHNIRSYKGDAAFSTWLYRITLNTTRDMQRSQASHRQKVTDMALITEKTHNPDRESELTRSQLWQTVHTLPDKQRDAILLVHSEGLNHREAAQILDCSESTISWHIHEAKKTLKSLLGTEEVAV